MKSRMPFSPTAALLVMFCSQAAPVLVAQSSSPAPASAGAAAPAPTSVTRTIQLSPGVPEILKLRRGLVGDDVIIAFVVNSGQAYHLSASEVLYLREQGVSDPVLSAMLSTGQNGAATAAQAAPQPAAQRAPAGLTSDWANSTPQPAPATPQYAPAYDATAPVYAPPSTVYAYPAPSYGYCDYSWPWYWGYPGLSLGFGFGGGYYYGGYHGGGYRGGGYHGGGYGGYHGGGGHGGGGGHH
jgi:hypothetical protein